MTGRKKNDMSYDNSGFKMWDRKPFNFIINMKQFAFQIGYSYEELEEESHLFWITIAFLHIDIAWKPMFRKN